MQKALFLDRDGVIVRGVYYHGHPRTILTPEETEYITGIFNLLKHAQEKKYKIIIISNQPGIGLGRLSEETFQKISQKIVDDFRKQSITIVGAYYCFHHPYAKIAKYKKMCDCRKPEPGMLLQAAKEHNINLSKSFFIGDGVNDVIAGHRAGCKTILVANVLESEYLRLLEKNLKGIKPDYLIKKISEVSSML